MVQKWPFFKLFVLLNIGQENIFYDMLGRKNSFLNYKNKKLKESKNWSFSLKVFVQKWPFFQLFFLWQYREGKCFYDILERKNAFLGYKNNKFKKSKNWHFCVHGLCPKMAIFATFCFIEYRPRKYLLRYVRTKKRLSKL